MRGKLKPIRDVSTATHQTMSTRVSSVIIRLMTPAAIERQDDEHGPQCVVIGRRTGTVKAGGVELAPQAGTLFFSKRNLLGERRRQAAQEHTAFGRLAGVLLALETRIQLPTLAGPKRSSRPTSVR